MAIRKCLSTLILTVSLCAAMIIAESPDLAASVPVEWHCSKGEGALVPCQAIAWGPDKLAPLYNATFSCTLASNKTMACLSGHRSCSANSPVVLNRSCSAVSRFNGTLIPEALLPRPTISFKLGKYATIYKPRPTIQPQLFPKNPNAVGADILFEKRSRPQHTAPRDNTCDQYCEFHPFPKREAVPSEFLPHSRLYIPDGQTLDNIEAYVSGGLRRDDTVSSEERVRIVEAVLNNAEHIGSLRDLMRRNER